MTDAETKLAIAGIEVCAYSEVEEVEELPPPCATTAASGNYTISGIQPGKYKVGFAAPIEGKLNYVPQYYNAKPSYAEAEPLTVTSGGALTNINAEMHPGGEISGEVTAAATHAGISGIMVCALGTSEPFLLECARTASGGEYTITSLPTGAYKVLFEPFESTLNYASQFYKDASSLSTATTVVATAGGIPVSGINAELQVRGGITGRVIDASTKAGLDGVEVCALRGTEAKQEAVACALSDPNGNYTIADLRSGEYRVGFFLKQYVLQYHPGKATFSAAQLVNVAAGETTSQINAELTRRVSEPRIPAPAALPVGPPGGASAGVLGAHVTAVSAAEIKSLLSHLSTPSGRGARIAELLKHGAYSLTFGAPVAGRLAISWYVVPKGAHLSRVAPVLVAEGRRTFTSAGQGKVAVKLTRRGRALLRSSTTLRLTDEIVFIPTGQPAVSELRAFTLKR